METSEIMGSQESVGSMGKLFSSQEMTEMISEIGNCSDSILENSFVDTLPVPDLLIPKLEQQPLVTSSDDCSMPSSAIAPPKQSSAIAPPKQPSVISTEDYSGVYNFEIFIDPQVTKSPWVYSSILNKVFILPTSSFPVDFKWTQEPFEKVFFVRAMVVYSQPSDAHRPVERCFNHSHENEKTNEGVPPHIWKHVIRAINNHANYVGNKGEHLSVAVPLEEPQTGADTTTQMYQFVCQNSCVTGMNRKPVKVVFTLENVAGRVYGRKCVSVRVCSCPKRDKEKAEAEYLGKTENTNQQSAKRRKMNHSAGKKPSSFSDAHVDTKEYELPRVKITGKQNVKAVLKYCHDLMSGESSLHGIEEPYKRQMKDLLHAMRNLPE